MSDALVKQAQDIRAQAAALLVRAGGTLAMELPGARSDPVIDGVRSVRGWRDAVTRSDESGLERMEVATRADQTPDRFVDLDIP